MQESAAKSLPTGIMHTITGVTCPLSPLSPGLLVLVGGETFNTCNFIGIFSGYRGVDVAHELHESLATGLVLDHKKAICSGFCMNKMLPDLESHVCKLLEIDSMTEPVKSFAFTRHEDTGVGQVDFLLSAVLTHSLETI